MRNKNLEIELGARAGLYESLLVTSDEAFYAINCKSVSKPFLNSSTLILRFTQNFAQMRLLIRFNSKLYKIKTLILTSF